MPLAEELRSRRVPHSMTEIEEKIHLNPAVLLTLLKHGANIDLETISRDKHTALDKARDNLNVNILLSVVADMFVQDPQDFRASSPIQEMSIEHANFRSVLKELAMKKARLQQSTEFEKERRIVTAYPELWSYYQDCTEKISWAMCTRFIEMTCTFFELLTKSHDQIAMRFSRNSDFESKFEQHDLDHRFPVYADDIRRAFKRAQCHYHFMLEQEALINEAVYHALPYIVVMKTCMVRYSCMYVPVPMRM